MSPQLRCLRARRLKCAGHCANANCGRRLEVKVRLSFPERTGAFSRTLEPASLLINEICSLCSNCSNLCSAVCFFTGCSSSVLVSEPKSLFHITHSSSLPLARDFVLAATDIRLAGCDFAGRLKIAGTSGTSTDSFPRNRLGSDIRAV